MPEPLSTSADVAGLRLPPQPVTQPVALVAVPAPHDSKSLNELLNYVEFSPSPREKLLIDTLVATKSFRAAVDAVNEKFKRKHKIYTVKAWIRERSHVRFYLAEKLKEAGIADVSKNQWLADMVMIAKTDKKIHPTTATMYKLIGEAKGFFPSEKQGAVTINGSDLKINILQMDGEA